jgi:hypothetical protein
VPILIARRYDGVWEMLKWLYEMLECGVSISAKRHDSKDNVESA